VGWTRAVGVGIDGDVRGEKVSLIYRTTCFRPALCFPSLSFLQASENGCHANHSSPCLMPEPLPDSNNKEFRLLPSHSRGLEQAIKVCSFSRRSQPRRRAG
jgi:hypothetical protein